MAVAKFSKPTKLPLLSDSGHVTIDFRWGFWRPDPNAKYYFAIVAENEAYNQADWRTRTLTGFLQIVTVA